MSWVLPLIAMALTHVSTPAATRADAVPSGVPVFVTLGTGGGPVVQTRRSQPANAVVVGDAVYLFDVGEGTQRQLKAAGLPLANIRAIFLSHHHLDHVGGLGPLLVNRWIMKLAKPVLVVGPPGTKEMSAGIVSASGPTVRAPLSLDDSAAQPLASTFTATDMSANMASPVEIYRDDRIRVLAIAVDHYHFADGEVSTAARSYAFRIEGGGRSIVFSGDTGPSAGLERLAQRADLFVSEVIDRPAITRAIAAMRLTPTAEAGFLRHMDLDHLSPAQVGAIAARAKVGALVLTHLVPGRDEETNTAGYVAGIATVYKGPVTVASDGQRF